MSDHKKYNPGKSGHRDYNDDDDDYKHDERKRSRHDSSHKDPSRKSDGKRHSTHHHSRHGHREEETGGRKGRGYKEESRHTRRHSDSKSHCDDDSLRKDATHRRRHRRDSSERRASPSSRRKRSRHEHAKDGSSDNEHAGHHHDRDHHRRHHGNHDKKRKRHKESSVLKKKRDKEKHKRKSSSSNDVIESNHVLDKKVDRSTLVSMGPIRGTPPDHTIDPVQDYFAYHEHLRLYLYRDLGQYFEDLSSAQAREVFETFCSKYNQGHLEEGFYNEKELPQEALQQCQRTKHKWNFSTSTAEKQTLSVIKEGVKKQTSYSLASK